MGKVTILGAGDMGAALATLLARNGHDVDLWGTERDAVIVEALRLGQEHPRLKITLPANVTIHDANEAAAALDGAEVVVVAITSDAVRLILDRLAPTLGNPRAIVTVAKGFDAGPRGASIQLLPETIAEFSASPVVAVGGPSKANEVARGQPTSVVFGSREPSALDLARATFATSAYRIEPTADIIGLEIAAAMKNAYAIALGITDGLERRTGLPHHNLRAALFPMAVREMAVLARLMGGQPETATGLAGCGDLLVTITSGRNRLLGQRLGAGEPAAAAIRALTESGTTIEGYPAVDFGQRIARGATHAGTADAAGLPLLNAIWRVLHEDADAERALLDVL